MELWIRNQDRTNLIKANDIFVCNQVIYVFKEENRVLVAEYKSKERALEVLDEIQNIFKPPLIIQKTEGFITTADNSMHIINPTYGDIKELSVVVYQMPKE